MIRWINSKSMEENYKNPLQKIIHQNNHLLKKIQPLNLQPLNLQPLNLQPPNLQTNNLPKQTKKSNQQKMIITKIPKQQMNKNLKELINHQQDQETKLLVKLLSVNIKLLNN